MYLLLIAMLLSPIHLWKSSLPQISHMVAAMALGSRLVVKPITFYYEKELKWMPFFLLYATLVAAVVFSRYSDVNTLLAPIYYIFGFLLFLLIITIYLEEGKKFLGCVLWSHLIVLAIVAILSASGVGRSIIHDGTRMMLTFNNPNQMANWAIWVAVSISACGWAIYRSWMPGLLALFLTSVIVIISISRSGFIGIAALTLVYIFLGLSYLIATAARHWNISKARLTRVAVPVLLIAGIVLIGLGTNYYMSDGAPNITFIDNMIYRIVNTDFSHQISLRAIDRLWQYPQYLLFGAGEGALLRFGDEAMIARYSVIYEIHSSWFGLLFNYGLIGFIFFTKYLCYLIKRIDFYWFKLLIFAAFFYSFFNYNIRNWYFWVCLAVVYSCSLCLKQQDEKEKEHLLINVSDALLNSRRKIVARLSGMKS